MSDGLYLIDPVKDAQHVANCLAHGGFGVRPASMPVAKPPVAVARRRKVTPVSITGATPAVLAGSRPRFVMADPKTLLVDETYQRNLSEKSLRLIRKIVAEWSWRKFSPPVAAETPAGLELIDGQHTAIAAASHPTVGHIPVMVVDAVSLEDRARAFVSHNTDRLGMTAMQLHYAAVAGGVAANLEIDQVAKVAGVIILRVSPAKGVYKPGETIAVAAIGALISKRGGALAGEILRVLVDAGLGPINAGMIKAVDLLLHDPEFNDQVSPAGLTRALAAIKETWVGEAAVFAATHRVPVWKALASVLFRKAKERRRAGVGE